MDPKTILQTTLCHPKIIEHVDETWNEISLHFEDVARSNTLYMNRTELSFHEDTKLLGYLALLEHNSPGDICEIGMWKGKSLSLMARLSSNRTKVIGIDPLELQGQFHDFNVFKNSIFPETITIHNYSELAYSEVRSITNGIKLLHIDGGHKKENVFLDFLLYSKLVLPSGWVIFDDYEDSLHSPEVKIAINGLNQLGFFSNYFIVGSNLPFKNSFALRKMK